MQNIIREIESIKDEAILNEIKKQIDMQIEKNYYRKQNFMFHETIDEYLYVVFYQDDKHTYATGKQAYDVFMNNSDAMNVQRKTKDLFPTYELLLSR